MVARLARTLMLCPRRELAAALDAPVAVADRGGGAGAVVWITGLSGAGKSTLAAAVVERLRADGVAANWLDGDALRARLRAGHAVEAYGEAQRRRLAMQYGALATGLAASGRVVVVSTISLFHAVHAANRVAAARYLEVLLRAPDAVRRRRAADAAGGPRVGAELAAEFPLQPDLVLDNDADPARIAQLADRVLQRLWR